MNIADFNAIKNRFEPEASAGDDSEFLLISCAISLKRIADALWGTDGTTGVLQLLNPLDTRNHF